MKRLSPLMRRLAMFFCLFILIVALSGCRTTRPKKWWEFWRKSTPTVYPEEVGIYPPPDVPPADLTSPSTLPGGEGSLPEADPVRQEASGMVSELKTVHFDYNSYQISPEMQDLLRQNAAWIKSHSGITIQIEGHCDERGSNEYNISLGQKRADMVREFLAREGIDPQSLVTISYGEDRPLPDAMGHDEESWGRNRRAQFLIY